MSAFTVGAPHIDTIVNAMRQFAGVPVPAGAPRGIGQMLWDENYASVNHRYSESEPTPDYSPTLTDAPLSPIAVLKALDCYEYQSCEHPGWKTSDAHTLINAVRGIIFTDHPEWAREIFTPGSDVSRPAYTQSAEYSAAPWEVDSLDQVAAVIVKAEREKAVEEAAHAGEGSVYREQGHLNITEIAKRMRVNLRNAQSVGMLPEGAKFSVTTDRFSGGQSIDVEVRGMPDSWTYTTRESIYGGEERIYSDAAQATVKAIEQMLAEYNRDRSDIQSDYFDVWFYSHVKIESESHAAWRIDDAAKRKARAAARKARKH